MNTQCFDIACFLGTLISLGLSFLWFWTCNPFVFRVDVMLQVHPNFLGIQTVSRSTCLNVRSLSTLMCVCECTCVWMCWCVINKYRMRKYTISSTDPFWKKKNLYDGKQFPEKDSCKITILLHALWFLWDQKENHPCLGTGTQGSLCQHNTIYFPNWGFFLMQF